MEYEGLHFICFGFGRFGHRVDSCPLVECKTNVNSQAPTEHIQVENRDEHCLGEEGEGHFGPWMMAKRRNSKLMARPETKGKHSVPRPLIIQSYDEPKFKGSQFGILEKQTINGELLPQIEEEIHGSNAKNNTGNIALNVVGLMPQVEERAKSFKGNQSWAINVTH
ncbi:unnamed protein product [Lupinus luteus]|uniref:Zinc knuckle CX2CX4HX4C domain-containing protein n=1 Tax=Lupinus luteus TaxID=3873 RepID=A0AAV1Y3N3_LUPLU